ncbi:hypothetical protein [Bacillus thuringiensis]|nr:hypothetical protein [Bacillus thuringiensis]
MKIITDKDMVVMGTVEPNIIVSSGTKNIKLEHTDTDTLQRIVTGMEQNGCSSGSILFLTVFCKQCNDTSGTI